MKKLLSLMLALAMALPLTACGKTASTDDESTPQAASNPTATPDDTVPVETPDASEPEDSVDASGLDTGDASSDATVASNEGQNILIAYFSYGENAPLPDDVDASSSASIQLREDGSITGNTGILADMIAQATGGDLFSIRTVEQYPDNYDDTLDVGQSEKHDGTYPELATHIENLDSYDTIFLGFPNWWYGMPMVIYSFLEEYDFSGKTIIPFVTSGGSGFSDAISEIESAEPNAVVLDGLAISYDKATTAQDNVRDWLAELGIAG